MEKDTIDGVLSPIQTPKKKRRVNMSYQAKERRRRVITRLEAQLKSGHKKPKGDPFTMSLSPIEEKDTARIKKELETLKTRI